MFVGHYGLAFAAKNFAPRVSLGTLIFATWWIDFLWAPLVLMEIEFARVNPFLKGVVLLDLYDQPISHSLAGMVLWASLLAFGHFFFKRNWRDAAIVGGVVISHWMMDLIVHREDLPVWFDSTTGLGLGAWNLTEFSILLELGILAFGFLLYCKATTPKDRAGNWGPWSLAIFLVVLLFGVFLGPPPPSVGLFAWAMLAQLLIVAYAAWFDRHRTPRATPSRN
jgi:hypothetical protein